MSVFEDLCTDVSSEIPHMLMKIVSPEECTLLTKDGAEITLKYSPIHDDRLEGMGAHLMECLVRTNNALAVRDSIAIKYMNEHNAGFMHSQSFGLSIPVFERENGGDKIGAAILLITDYLEKAMRDHNSSLKVKIRGKR